MGNRNMQYVAVTKERKKTGCLGVAGHGCLTVFTGGIWLLIGPPMHWLWHLIGPRKKSVTRAYGPGVQQPAAPPPQPYPGPPQQPYAQQPLPGGPWQQPPAPDPEPQPPYSVGQPPGADPPTPPPDDPWDTGNMRRRN